MNQTLELFIGANNTTKQVELNKIKQVLSKYHEGFTINTAQIGYWLGTEEPSVSVLIHDDLHKIISTIKELKEVLHQDAIAYHVVETLEFI